MSDVRKIADLALETLEGKPQKTTKAEAKKERTWRSVSPDWKPNAHHAQRARELGYDKSSYLLQLEKFRLHEFKVPRVDPDRAFMNWLINGATRYSDGQHYSAPPETSNTRPYHRPFEDDRARQVAAEESVSAEEMQEFLRSLR